MNSKVAVIGCGNWGKNLVATFYRILEPERVVCCDQNKEVLERLTKEYSGITIARDLRTLWDDPSITAVAIATPALTHYSIARQALQARKHVFVEKPLTTASDEASDLCALAEREQRVLMVDHLLLFHPAIQALEQVIMSGELGRIYHLYSRRTNAGIVRSEENALWSLGPHDIAVMLRLVGRNPVRVAAQGGSYLQPRLGIQDVVFVTLVFPEGQVGHSHLSWLDPRKTREMTVVGSDKMAVFDDLEPVQKLRIYDKRVEPPLERGIVSNRDGSVAEISLSPEEPLNLACQEFLASIQRGHARMSDGQAGLDVVRILEAAQVSLESQGSSVQIQEELVRG